MSEASTATLSYCTYSTCPYKSRAREGRTGARELAVELYNHRAAKHKRLPMVELKSGLDYLPPEIFTEDSFQRVFTVLQ